MSAQRFLDTNILIRFFTQDDAAMHRASSALMQRLTDDLETVTTNHLIIFECVFILEKSYRMPRANIRSAMEAFLVLRSLRIAERDLLLDALTVYEERNVTFADAYTAVFMRKQGIDEIYSWDKDFDRMSWVSRIEPT